MQDSIQLLISIDIEPAERLISLSDPDERWGLDDLFANLAEIRQAFKDRTGRPANFGWYWRMDPQIAQVYGDAAWPLKKYADQIAALLEDGDDCGVHTHAWRWDEAHGDWFTDHADQDWVAHCVETSFDAYEKFFGKPCAAVRFGDGWIDQATLDLVEDLGAAFDLTVEAGRLPDTIGMPGERFIGDIPDLRGAPRLPHRRSRDDFRCPGSGGDSQLWIVPVSTGAIRHSGDGKAEAVAPDARTMALSQRRSRMYRAVQNAVFGSRVGARVMRSGRARAVFNRGCQACLDVLTNSKRIEFLALNMIFQPFKYATLFNQALAQSQSCYIHTVLRSGDLETPHLRANFTENLDFVINHPQAHRFEVSTPSRLVASWERSRADVA